MKTKNAKKQENVIFGNIEKKEAETINNEEIEMFISKIINLLSKQIDILDEKIKEVDNVIARVKKVTREFDILTSNFNIINRYGFDENEMFYIGVASGRIYRRPINETIVAKIENIKKLNWREIGEIGDYFMYGKIKSE